MLGSILRIALATAIVFVQTQSHEDCKVLKQGVRHVFSANDFSATEYLLDEK